MPRSIGVHRVEGTDATAVVRKQSEDGVDAHVRKKCALSGSDRCNLRWTKAEKGQGRRTT